MVAEKVSTEEKQQALDLVCHSHTFARSDRLRSLLRFICQAEMEGRQDSINEYVIGVEALGRREGYSPSEDSCVRSRVYELRQRLEKFYATEAPDAPFRIDLPKGSYVPRYVRVADQPVESPEQHPLPRLAPEEDPLLAGRTSVSKRYWQLAATFTAGAVLMYGAMALREGVPVSGAQPDTQWTADLESIWRPFLDPKTPVLVSFQTRLFLSGGPIVVRDPNVDSFARMESSQPVMRFKEFFGVPQLYENRNYTDFGAANACLMLGRFLGGRKPDIFAKRSSDVNWEDLRNNNVIVLGKPHSDPDIARLLPKEHFLMDGGGRIRNLRPNPDEAAEWNDKGQGAWDRSNNWAEKYALVTMMPGPHPGCWILSMAGSGSEHLWAMPQFLTSAESARQLVAKLRNSSGEIPPSWQVVLRAHFKSQVPIKVEYVTHRILGSAVPTAR